MRLDEPVHGRGREPGSRPARRRRGRRSHRGGTSRPPCRGSPCRRPPAWRQSVSSAGSATLLRGGGGGSRGLTCDQIVPVPDRAALPSRLCTRQREGITTALLVIDVQESFRARDSWSTMSRPTSPTGSSRSSRPRGPPATTSSGSCTSSPAPATSSTRPRVTSGSSRVSSPGRRTRPDKTSHNAFTTTNLGQILPPRRHRGRRHRHPHRAVLRDHDAARERPRLPGEVRPRRHRHDAARAPGRCRHATVEEVLQDRERAPRPVRGRRHLQDVLASWRG